MAYDPKAYLQQALKSGFQPRYEPTGASPETGQETERYAGDEARFGDVVVRPLSEFVGQSEQDIGTPQQTGYSVDSPLGGQYQGWFRSDIYDNDGNFVRTAYVPPDNDKYGLKDLAQLGLTAASFGGLGATGQMISKGISGIAALKSGDPLRILSAASNIPGAGNLIPAELKTLMDYAGKAGQVQSALKGDPNAIFGLITGAAKSGAIPTGKEASAGYGGADPGFFDPDAETAPLPDWALDPYKTDTPAFTPSSDDAYEDIESLLARYTDQGFADTPTGDLSQSIDVTGTREKDIPDWDVLPDLVTTPRTIRDVAPVTQIKPGEKLEGTDIATPDLLKNLPTVPGKTTLPKVPAKSTKPAAQQGLDLEKLAFLLGAMNQRPKEKEEQQAAEYQPFDRELMYGLRG